MTGLLLAIQFLTRIPLPVRLDLPTASIGTSMRWFPLVGGCIGVLAALLDLGLTPFAGVEVRSILVVALLAGITGGLHLDGLMDSCDGLLAFTSRERRLEIMSDSRVGSFAVIGLATTLLLKYAAIVALPPALRPMGFMAMGALSRWAMVPAAVLWPAARTEGLGYLYKQSAGPVEIVWATALAALAVVPLHAAGAALLVVAFVVAAVVARYATAKIGGLTGDVYGAISEAVEIGVAIVLPPLARGML